MDLIKYFVENFNIRNYSIEASIYAESMNCNSLFFVVKPHGWWIKFRLVCNYGVDYQITQRRIVIENAEFLGRYIHDLERKLTSLLNNKEFINQLNSAIQKEKDRTKILYANTLQQAGVEFIAKG